MDLTSWVLGIIQKTLLTSKLERKQRIRKIGLSDKFKVGPRDIFPNVGLDLCEDLGHTVPERTRQSGLTEFICSLIHCLLFFRGCRDEYMVSVKEFISGLKVCIR